MYRPTYLTDYDKKARLKERLEEIRAHYKDGRGFFPRTTPNGSPSNSWLQVHGFGEIRAEDGGYTANLPKGWKADLPAHVVETYFDIFVKMDGGRRALTIRYEYDRSGRMVGVMIPAGQSWSANQRSTPYVYVSYESKESIWPSIALLAVIIFGFILWGQLSVNNRVTFERAETHIAALLSADEVRLLENSDNRFVFGNPYEVTFNVRADGETVSVHCQDGIFKPLFCSKRDT